MDLKLARVSLNEKPQSISLKKIEELITKEGQQFFYFDRDTSHKDLISLVQNFEKKGLNVYHRIVKYGLDNDDYMYEVHIL